MLIKQEQKQAANILARGERQLAGSGKIQQAAAMAFQAMQSLLL